MLLWVVAATVIGVVITILARKSRESSRPKDGEEQREPKGEEWLGHIHSVWTHSVWWMAGAGLGALKYIYKAWKTAPDGSAAKFGWGALLALIAAIAVFALVRFLDRKLNPQPTGDEIETQRDKAPTTFARTSATEKWEYRR
jgi:hypothetical protein